MDNDKQSQIKIPKWLLALGTLPVVLIIIGFVVDPDRNVWNMWKLAGFGAWGVAVVALVIFAAKNNKKG